MHSAVPGTQEAVTSPEINRCCRWRVVGDERRNDSLESDDAAATEGAFGDVGVRGGMLLDLARDIPDVILGRPLRVQRAGAHTKRLRADMDERVYALADDV